MSDQESEISQAAESNKSASFSTNGTDPGGFGAGSDGVADGGQFLAELAKAMQTTAAAEQARNAEETEQRRQSHIDAIRAREAIEAEELRELAKDDVKGIDAWSDGEIKRIKLERERRIAARREQLQIRLEEHRTVVGREVEAVEASVGAYRADIAEYFRRLESETDPVAIARYAGTRPPFPDLTSVGPDDVAGTTDYRAPVSDAQAAAPIETVEAGRGRTGRGHRAGRGRRRGGDPGRDARRCACRRAGDPAGRRHGQRNGWRVAGAVEGRRRGRRG